MDNNLHKLTNVGVPTFVTNLYRIFAKTFKPPEIVHTRYRLIFHESDVYRSWIVWNLIWHEIWVIYSKKMNNDSFTAQRILFLKNCCEVCSPTLNYSFSRAFNLSLTCTSLSFLRFFGLKHPFIVFHVFYPSLSFFTLRQSFPLRLCDILSFSLFLFW